MFTLKIETDTRREEKTKMIRISTPIISSLLYPSSSLKCVSISNNEISLIISQSSLNFSIITCKLNIICKQIIILLIPLYPTSILR